jgi:hypothetical protein
MLNHLLFRQLKQLQQRLRHYLMGWFIMLQL